VFNRPCAAATPAAHTELTVCSQLLLCAKKTRFLGRAPTAEAVNTKQKNKTQTLTFGRDFTACVFSAQPVPDPWSCRF
jgi:hypothetical protein